MIVKVIAAIFFLIAFLVFGSAVAVAFYVTPAADFDPLDLW